MKKKNHKNAIEKKKKVEVGEERKHHWNYL